MDKVDLLSLRKEQETKKEVVELSLTAIALFPPAPLKMSETLFDNFEKMTKKQNKEQVPPPPPPAEPQNKKPLTNKPPKKLIASSTLSPTKHKSLEEAFKAVSICRLFLS